MLTNKAGILLLKLTPKGWEEFFLNFIPPSSDTT